MLYGSTRSKVETYTAQRTLWTERAGDGGFFVPLKLPQFKRTEIIRLKNRTPEDNLALILNKFFQTEFSGKDVQFAIGRDYFRLVQIRHKVTLAELWHNVDGAVDNLIRLLVRRISAEQRDGEPGEWPRIVVRIALLFAVFGQLFAEGEVSTIYPMDLAVPTGDFTWPMAAWYARKMGLPIGTIICCSCENDGVRELLHRGQMRMDPAAQKTIVPRCDSGPDCALERLIFTALGWDEAAEYHRVGQKGGVYVLNPEQKRLLAEGLYVTVNSSARLAGVIPNAWKTFGHVLCPYGALVYTGVMDYQAITGKYNKVLMLCDYAPVHSLDTMTRAMGISAAELKQRLNLK